MIVEALLLSLVAYFGYCSNKFFGDSMLNRPLVTATLTALCLEIYRWVWLWRERWN